MAVSLVLGDLEGQHPHDTPSLALDITPFRDWPETDTVQVIRATRSVPALSAEIPVLQLPESRCYSSHIPTRLPLTRIAATSKRSDGSRMVHVRLDPDLHRRLRIVVAAEDTSLQDWLSRIVVKAVNKRRPNVVRERE